ncbi:MAG: ABC transporter permease [Pseudomonas sp.]
MTALSADRKLSAWLLAPGLGWLALFLLLPCLLVLVYSFLERGAYGGIDYVFTWENYRRAVDPLYLDILLRSAKIAGLATLFAVLIGYPAAYAITRTTPRRQAVYLFLVMLPFWSNYLIRTYAWIVLLNREGLLNRLFSLLGYSGEPINMLYTDATVVLGLVYNYIPFVILAIYSSLSRIDNELWEASRDLGASGWTTFRRVILPLLGAGRGRWRGVRLRALHRQLHHRRPAGRQAGADGRQPDLRAVPHRARLAVRRGAELLPDRHHAAVAVHPGHGLAPGPGRGGRTPCVTARASPSAHTCGWCTPSSMYRSWC